MRNKLLIATNNPGKIIELRELLAGLEIELLGLSNFPGINEVEETGVTFAENARLKAVGYAQQSGVISLADDSGLEVAALDGRPGVLSARYGGDGTTFAKKMEMLLDELKNTDSGDRSARFVCAMSIADPNGRVLFESEGVCIGRIALSPTGTSGFGYDPLFIPEGYVSSFGELADNIKQNISHRAHAFSQIIPCLQDFIEI